MNNIITGHTTLPTDLNEEDSNSNMSVEDIVDEQFDYFLQAVASDGGLATLKDLFYNGMQIGVQFIQTYIAAGVADADPLTTPTQDLCQIVEQLSLMLNQKDERGEIDLSYCYGDIDDDTELEFAEGDENFDDDDDDEEIEDDEDDEDDEDFEVVKDRRKQRFSNGEQNQHNDTVDEDDEDDEAH